MSTFFLSIWLVISGFLGFAPQETSSHTTNETVDETPLPVNTPRQSAPQPAISACTNKNDGQNCSFSISNQDLNGICQPSGDVLACTPRLPE